MSVRHAPDLQKIGGILLSGVHIAAFGQPHHNAYEPHTKRQENEVRDPDCDNHRRFAPHVPRLDRAC